MATKKAMTFVGVDSDSLESSGVSAFIADVKAMGTMQVTGVTIIPKKDDKQQSDVNNQWGRRFISVLAKNREYKRVGFNVFCKALLTIGGISKIAVLPDKKEKLESVLRSQAFKDALSRQRESVSE